VPKKSRRKFTVFRRHSLAARKGWQTRRNNARRRTDAFKRRSLAARKAAATRRLKREGIEKGTTREFGVRKLVYEYYTIPVLAPELVQAVVDAASIDAGLFSVSLLLEILEERTNQTFTNQTPFILFDEPGMAETLTNQSTEIVDDPSPDITEQGRKKPHYSLVSVTVVIQRPIK